MKRIIIKLIIFLFLGAAVNVAVAWGIAFQSTLTIDAPISAYSSLASFRGYAVIHSSTGHVHSFMANGAFGELLVMRFAEPDNAEGDVYFEEIEIRLALDGEPRLALPYWATSAICLPAPGRERAAGFAVARGWPLLSLFTVFQQTDFDVDTVKYEDFAIVPWTGIMKGPPAGSIAPPQSLSLVPIWPGFALNTIFYAAILWILFITPFALRRWRRVQRGLCAACAYPVGTNNVCTECGRPVRAQTVSPFPAGGALGEESGTAAPSASDGLESLPR